MNAHITTNTTRTVSAGTVARTAVLLLALTNQILSAMGKPILPIESQTVEQLVTAGITTVAALVEEQQLHGGCHSGGCMDGREEKARELTGRGAPLCATCCATNLEPFEGNKGN